MNSNEYLRRYRTLDAEINSKLEQVKKLDVLASKISPSTDFISSNGTSDRVGKTVAKIIDLKNDINEDIEKLVFLHKRIMHIVNLMPTPICRVVLEKNVFLNKSFERIAEELGYSDRQIRRISDKAKIEFEEAAISLEE